MKVALVYDRVNKWGGAERVLQALHEVWPQAPLYTAVYHPQTASWADDFMVRPSFLNKISFAKTRHELLPFLMPLAFESFDFNQYDVVISITSEAAKGILTRPKTLYFCYCLTPTRYLWSGYQDYFPEPYQRFLTKPVISYLRAWDKVAAQRPDAYLAISRNVQRRIEQYYQRESEIIYPPIDTEKFKVFKGAKNSREKYFLVVSRLIPYKRVDLVIQTFNQLGLPLKIIGTGNQARKLRKSARKNIELLGHLTDQELLGYYQNCQALIFPQEEDLGLVPLEAQACGRPVIAFRSGGALETIAEGKTGLFFYPQTVRALIKVLKSFKADQFKPEVCRKNAVKFSQARFKKEIEIFIEERWMRKR